MIFPEELAIKITAKYKCCFSKLLCCYSKVLGYCTLVWLPFPIPWST